jgi:uncharacterized membrane protein|tara:strand:+ start:8561 stop:8791 length:231 start_codon:yes stop_codon:yes gene_type:complete
VQIKINIRYLFYLNQEIMALNKNKILGFSALLMLLVGLMIIYLGSFRFKEWKYILGLVGLGFCILAWAFNALRGRL